ncbi:MAG: hypothetical protein ACK43N_14375, partial [Pirellulaceae bacterium]
MERWHFVAWPSWRCILPNAPDPPAASRVPAASRLLAINRWVAPIEKVGGTNWNAAELPEAEASIRKWGV